MSMRAVLKRAGIKPRRWMRDLMTAERRKARRALVRIAGWCPLHASPATGVTWSDVEFYEASIPRSMRAGFRQWKRIEIASREDVMREILERATP